MTYLIAKYDANMNGDTYVSADSHGRTVHVDKAYHFETLAAATLAQRIHYPGELVIPARYAK